MTPACGDPERRERRQRIRNLLALLARTLTAEKRFKVLVAVGRVATLIVVLTVRSCS